LPKQIIAIEIGIGIEIENNFNAGMFDPGSDFDSGKSFAAY
jgi:hypothetical protein